MQIGLPLVGEGASKRSDGEAISGNCDAQLVENEAGTRRLCLEADSGCELAWAMLQWRA